MLNPKLNFDECLDHVKSGDGLETLIDQDLWDQRESIRIQEELLRALVLTDSPLIVRAEPTGFGGGIPSTPDKGGFHYMHWMTAASTRPGWNTPLDSLWNDLTVGGLGPFIHYLATPAPNDLDCEYMSPRYSNCLKAPVRDALLEFGKNAAIHSDRKHNGLWISSNGLLVCSEQPQAFNIHKTYKERLDLPSELDPLGRKIKRPAYWHPFRGPGQAPWKGFIRGNGLRVFATTEEVAVNTQRVAGQGKSNPPYTRVFMFSPAPFRT